MGCSLSSQSQLSIEDRLNIHIQVLQRLSKEKEQDGTDLEQKIRKECHNILDISKPQDKINSKIFYEIISAIDDLDLEYPKASDKVKTLTNAVKQVLRIRCLGQNTSQVTDSKEQKLDHSLHVHQRKVPENAIVAIDSNIPLKKNTSIDSDCGEYGFFDASSHNDNFDISNHSTTSPSKPQSTRMLRPLEACPEIKN